MSYQPDSDDDLSPEALEILKIILDDTRGLRAVDLADAPPATIPEAD